MLGRSLIAYSWQKDSSISFKNAQYSGRNVTNESSAYEILRALGKLNANLADVFIVICNFIDCVFSQNAPEVVCTNCSNADTMELIRRIFVHLPKTHCDHHIVQLMLDVTFIDEAND
jgi:ribosomal protein S27E